VVRGSGGGAETALSGWQSSPGRGSLLAMAHAPNPYRGFRYPTEVIQHAVWLYHCFSLSLRDVETIGSVKNLGRYAASWIAGWPRRPSSTAALT